MNIIKKIRWIIAGIFFGGIAGFLYWNYIGCLSGHCSITSVWYNSSIYGSMMGGLLASVFVDNNQKSKQQN